MELVRATPSNETVELRDETRLRELAGSSRQSWRQEPSSSQQCNQPEQTNIRSSQPPEPPPRTIEARRLSRQGSMELGSLEYDTTNNNDHHRAQPFDGGTLAITTANLESSRHDTESSSCSCWPCKSPATSRVVDSDSSSQPDTSSKHGTNRTATSKTKKRQRPKSNSLQAELMRIDKHQRLLAANQKELLVELNEELGAQGLDYDGGQGDGQRNARVALAGSAALELEGRRAAVECKNLSYHVGLGSFQRRCILNGVSLTVPEGAIYGLLGPSGCGKTTLLRCVAGRLTPEGGSIKVLGFEPNEPGSQIPGPAIGFMPQELSIYEEFTIYETLTYFGRINRMRAGLLQARIDFLLSFLNLPRDKGRLIKHLSGGQKRRVSLAVALVHSPPLLILDEPTVGVDPLLRQIIWKYLVTLATSERTTIVITTHYIEEARQANIVGLMRQGRMLAEDQPGELLRQHNLTTLENVFLKLCLTSDEDSSESDASNKPDGQHKLALVITGLELDKQHSAGLGVATTKTGQRQEESPTSGEFTMGPACKLRPMERGERYAPTRLSWRSWLSVLWALTWKNHLRLKRNPPVLAFEFILPAFQVLLFCWCIGGDPHDIPLAVVNDESVPQASRLFLGAISEEVFTQTRYNDLGAAIKLVERGQALAVVHIPENYTHHLKERLLSPADATNETLNNATIKLYPDLTNLHLALALESSFRDAFVKFARDTLNMLGYDTQLAELPIKIERAIYGSATRGAGGYLEFMAPGVIVSITYVMATGLTALAFILEKRDGLLERSQVSGVTTSQILLAHALLQVVVMIIQIILVLVVSFLVFRIPSRGPLGWVLLLVLLQGCAGMSYGLLISAVCNEENTAVMMLVGTFYINLILAGIIWPVEAMPNWLRLFSYLQPQTLPTESLRNILSRGWSIDEDSVQLGFLVTIGWLVVFLIGAGLCMRYIK